MVVRKIMDFMVEVIIIEAKRTILDSPEIVMSSSRKKIRRFIVGNFTKVTPLTWSP